MKDHAPSRTPFAPFRLDPPPGAPRGRWGKAGSTAGQCSERVRRAPRALREAPVLGAVRRERSAPAFDKSRSKRFARCERATPPPAPHPEGAVGRGARAGGRLERGPPRRLERRHANGKSGSGGGESPCSLRRPSLKKTHAWRQKKDAVVERRKRRRCTATKAQSQAAHETMKPVGASSKHSERSN